eukprot:SAG22_NODE_1119_length_5512_cov_40.815260_3_plen_252_part_00
MHGCFLFEPCGAVWWCALRVCTHNELLLVISEVERRTTLATYRADKDAAAAKAEAERLAKEATMSADGKVVAVEQRLTAEKAAAVAAATQRAEQAEREAGYHRREAKAMRERVDELIGQNAALRGQLTAAELETEQLQRTQAAGPEEAWRAGGIPGTPASGTTGPARTASAQELHGPLGGSFSRHLLLLRGVEEALHGAKAALQPQPGGSGGGGGVGTPARTRTGGIVPPAASPGPNSLSSNPESVGGEDL